MEIHCYPWIAMHINEYQWISMDIHADPSMPMDIHGCLWISRIHGQSYAGVGIGMGGGGGKKKTIKRHNKGSHFVKKWRFLMFSGISRKIFFLGVISGNINPPGGYRRRDPGFWKPRFRPKVKVWKRFGRFILMIFCYLSGTDNSVALTFRGGFE